MKISKIKTDRRGFTLVEMVIVITIIGIVSSIGVTKYSTVQENAKKNADYATAANLATIAMIALSDEQSADIDNLASKGYIQFKPKSKSVKKEFKIVTINSGEGVEVKAGGVTFYPKPDENKPTT